MSARRAGPPEARVTGWRAALIWLVAMSGIVAIGLGQIFNPTDLIIILIIGEVVVSFGLVGAVIVTRVPGNPVGWLLSGSGAALGWGAAGIAYATQSVVTCGGCLPATVPIALLANVGFAPIFGAVGIFIPLLFPDGRLPSPRWRPAAWLGLASIALFMAVLAFSPGDIAQGIAIANPIGIEGFDGPNGPVGIAAVATLALSMVLALASVVWRFRHADAVQRQQLRWFGYAALVMAAALVIGVSGTWDAAWVVIFAGLGLMPLATGVAILRYRLYDLDRLVSRTIAYAVVTGGLILVYLAINLGLSTLFSSLASGNSAVVAASTLAVAALFTPLRRRVQRVVDRRFDRARYDAEQTTAAFSERLRNEIDLPSLVTELHTTVNGAIAPSRVGVWLRAGER
jgi:hypothetical protein